MTTSKTDDILKNIFLNIDNPISFSSKFNLYKEAQKRNISKKTVDKFLQKHEAYYVHRPAIKTFKYKKMTGSSLYSHVQADIKDLNAFKASNNNFRYFLLIIDCYSKRVFCEPLKDKKPETVLNAFQKVFKENSFLPYFLLTDAGTEFFNRKMEAFCKENQIQQVALGSSPAKAAIAERAIKTITTRLARAMTYKNTHNWVQFLYKTVKNYNNTIHSSIGMKPNDVNKNTRFQKSKLLKGKPKYKEGSIVSISKNIGQFGKAYLGKWSKELFKIKTINNKKPIVYTLVDLNNEPIKGLFYEPELQKVCNENNIYHVEKILDRKTVQGRKYVLVRWQNYGPQFDSWEPVENVHFI